MEKIITPENLRLFAYSNHAICAKPIRGLVVSFFGLGAAFMYDEDPADAVEFAKAGILYVVPYQNPWAWQNRQNVDYTDEIIDVLMDAFQLPRDLPIVSSGGSMGGLSALVYMVYAKRTPLACVTNCPVCDLPYHYTERTDLPRTLYSAFYHYEGSLQEALQSASPIDLVEKMPEASYCIFHCTADQAVNKAMHSDRFVEALGRRFPVEYYAVPDRGHCDLGEEMGSLYYQHIFDAIGKP